MAAEIGLRETKKDCITVTCINDMYLNIFFNPRLEPEAGIEAASAAFIAAVKRYAAITRTDVDKAFEDSLCYIKRIQKDEEAVQKAGR